MSTAQQKSSVVPPNHHTHMGTYLRELREYYGIDTATIAHELRFRQRYIIAIENGDIDDLPGKVYARGYVYKYAEFLGLNGAETVEGYTELSAAQPAANDFTFTPEESEQLAPKEWSLWGPLAGLAAVIALVFWLSGGDGFSITPDADSILLSTAPAASDLTVRPIAHSCETTPNSPLPCWQSALALPQHGFSPTSPAQIRNLSGQ